MHCPVLLRHLIQNTGVKIVYTCNDREIHSFINTFISCFSIYDKMLPPFQRPSSSHGARSSPVQSKLRQVETLLSAQA